MLLLEPLGNFKMQTHCPDFNLTFLICSLISSTWSLISHSSQRFCVVLIILGEEHFLNVHIWLHFLSQELALFLYLLIHSFILCHDISKCLLFFFLFFFLNFFFTFRVYFFPLSLDFLAFFCKNLTHDRLFECYNWLRNTQFNAFSKVILQISNASLQMNLTTCRQYIFTLVVYVELNRWVWPV